MENWFFGGCIMKGFISLVLSFVLFYVLNPLISSLPYTLSPGGLVVKAVAILILWIICYAVLNALTKS